MGLVRYLPVPSDRMGIIWSLLHIDDSIVLEYGPAGTTHYSMGLYGNLGIRFQNRLFTTHINEDDVVMGDVTRLEEALIELDKSYSPKAIFVVASSVTAIIGTDIKGVCRYMQKEVQAKLIPVEQSGFGGDYTVGVSEIYQTIIKSLAKDNVPKSMGTYNILGASAWHYRISSDLWEVENLLKESFGLECNVRLCCDTSVEELENIGAAEINIVLSHEGLKAAQMLEERFATPYVYIAPYGYSGTIKFLETVGKVLEKSINPLVLMRMNMKQKSLSMLGMFRMMSGNVERNTQAVVKGEYDTVLGISNFLEEAGVNVRYKLCTHSLKNIDKNLNPDIEFADEDKWIELVKPLKDTLVLADDMLLSQCDASNIKVRISSPCIKGAQIAKHLPFMGEKGADFLLEIVQEYYQK